MSDVASMEVDPVATGGPSKRARVKSQRALESEQTDRLFARARAQERAIATSMDLSHPPSSNGSNLQGGSRKPKGRRGMKKSVVEYCICKTDGEEGTPMIECGICNDWFHFFCIHLTENEAEKIHKFVCPGCEIRTGEKTTHIYDVDLYASPPPITPLDGLIPPPKGTKQKPSVSKASQLSNRATDLQRPKQKRKSVGPSSSAASSSDSGSEAEVGNTSDSSVASASTNSKVKPKRPRIAPARSSVSNAVDKKAPQRKASTTQLHPTRAHVIKRMSEVMSGFFGDVMSAEKLEAYAAELEQGLWEDRKELVNGKEAPGVKYKTQFNLLASSLSRPIREDLRESILQFSLSPRQVAQLTSVDLASLERIKELEAAKHAVLAQTVKSKEDGPAAIRLGRDGLERAEDNREKEMKAIQVAEEMARDREERRLSLIDSPTPGPLVETGAESASVSVGQHDSDLKNATRAEIAPVPTVTAGSPATRSSVPVESPLKPRVSISSAWGAAGDAGRREEETVVVVADQNQIDLSDMDFGNVDEVDFTSEDVAKAENEQVKPIVWSGVFCNPAVKTPGPVKAVVQHASSSTAPLNWSSFLPQPMINMTGRLAVDQCLSFLSTSRFNPNKELVAIIMSPDPESTDEEKGWWNDIAEDYLKRGRHGVYKPYGEKQPTLPGKCNELYLIPLRPDATPPEETELIDGFSVHPNRTEMVYIGVFVSVREATPSNVTSRTPIAASTTTPLPLPTPTPLANAPTPDPSRQPPPAPPVVPNEHLAKLMASLPSSILAPPPSGHSPIQGALSPTVPAPAGPHGVGGYTPPQGYYPPPAGPSYPAQGGYNAYPPSYTGYQPPMGYYDQPQHPVPPHGYDGRRNGPRGGNDWQRNNSGRGGRQDNRFDGRERDSGWGSRGGGSGYGR